MPQIKTYDSDVRAPLASQAGSEAYEIEGRHVESAYAQAGNAIGGGLKTVGEEIQQHQEMQDTSSNSVAGAAAMADLSTKLQQSSAAAAADPANAQKHFQDFQSAMEDTISKIGTDNDTTAGQKNAERIQNTLREEFTRQSMGAQSIVAGQQVKTNLDTMSNTLAQAVSNNPTLLETGIAMLHGSVEDQLKAHNLSPEENARIRNEFTQPAIKGLGIAAFKSMAESNPQGALDQLQKGRFAGMFSGEEIGALTTYANSQAKAQTTAQRAAIEQQKQADEAAFNANASAIVGAYIQPDGSMAIPKNAPQAIVKLSLMPQAKPGEIKSLADMTQTILKDQEKKIKATSDPMTYQSFATKLTSGNLSAQEVYEARTQGLLSDKDTSFYLRGINALRQDPAKKDAEKQFNQWAMSQKSAFTKPSGAFNLPDPHGNEKFNQFYQDAHARFEQTYSTKGDWQSLLNAKNPQYLGQFAKPYMSNVKGATAPIPRFTSDDQVRAFLAKTPRAGVQFIGPDGHPYYTKGK
jgi:hypothetical protein